MRREPKRARPERAVGSAISRRPLRARAAAGPTDAAAAAEPHASLWLDALDPDAPAPAAPPAYAAALAIPFFIAAVFALGLLKSAALHILVPLALVVAGLLVVARAGVLSQRRASGRWGRKPPADLGASRGRGPRRGLELEGDRLSFRKRRPPATAALHLEPLRRHPPRDSAPRARRRPAHLRLGHVLRRRALRRRRAPHRRPRPRSRHHRRRRRRRPRLDRPRRRPALIAPEDFVTLLDTLSARSPSCLDRFVLTDARGADLTLDGRALLAGDRSIDLDAPLEWRAIVFQEAFGQSVAVYQGTWVRQGNHELVFVCLLPSLGPAIFADIDLAGLDRAQGQAPKAPLSGLLRDIRLMQATPEQPPPTEQRVAIDRHFMLPVRCALDRAPRAAQQHLAAREPSAAAASLPHG